LVVATGYGLSGIAMRTEFHSIIGGCLFVAGVIVAQYLTDVLKLERTQLSYIVIWCLSLSIGLMYADHISHRITVGAPVLILWFTFLIEWTLWIVAMFLELDRGWPGISRAKRGWALAVLIIAFAFAVLFARAIGRRFQGNKRPV
jgi:hypothetical protein